jgi:hypothetical protein
LQNYGFYPNRARECGFSCRKAAVSFLAALPTAPEKMPQSGNLKRNNPPKRAVC